MTETDKELLKDLRIDYTEGSKSAAPFQCMETYEQERKLAADLIDRLRAEIERLRAALESITRVGGRYASIDGHLRSIEIARNALNQ